MKKAFMVVGSIVLIMGTMIGIFALSLSQNMKTIRAIPLSEMNLETLDDGTYRGHYYFEDQIGATLDVTIVSHEITNITVVEHICGKGTIAEALLDDIVRDQTIDVDVVAGATTSSHVLKLAVLDALEVE